MPTKKKTVKKATKKAAKRAAKPRAAEGKFFWYFDNYDSPAKWVLQDSSGTTIGEVMYLDEGGAEGGLGLVMRMIAGSKGAKAPPPSDAGWYATGTFEKRGYWSKIYTPYPTATAAKKALMLAFTRGDYMKSKR
jgi:hypothetical protein